MNSENLKLASYWFHCVKVDSRVTEEGHPFHSLFAGKNAPRMVLSSWNGKVQYKFLATSKDKIKWDKIVKVLKVEYKRDPKKAVKDLYTVLSKYDFIDSKEKELKSQMDRAKDKNKQSRIKALEKKLEELKSERAETEKREQKLRELILLKELEDQKAKSID
jgi:vacuolar-type H+-ATPase subunit I/STV1